MCVFIFFSVDVCVCLQEIFLEQSIIKIVDEEDNDKNKNIITNNNCGLNFRQVIFVIFAWIRRCVLHFDTVIFMLLGCIIIACWIDCDVQHLACVMIWREAQRVRCICHLVFC